MFTLGYSPSGKFELSYSASWKNSSNVIQSVVTVDTITPRSTKSWFHDASKCTSMDLSKLDTSKDTDMSAMFGDCDGLTSLDLSGFNTSQVTDMSSMFWDCDNLLRNGR